MIQSKTILKVLSKVLKEIEIPQLGKKLQGKVRDFYILKDKRIIITTDRQSAFDVILGHIPFKGAVLNQLSQFWFEKTKDIVPNHIIDVPDPNVMVTKNCEAIPVEMIVRGYMSGVTKTSIWHSYQKGDRLIYGIKFPEGLKKNDKLPNPIVTPTTHGTGPNGHDERLTRGEIIKRKIVDEKLYKQMEKATLALFERGSKIAKKAGFILVDTKYEFGLYNGKLTLIDEVHTPDSSRFWVAKTYKERIRKGLEPENFDKEFLRLWYAKKGYTGDGTPPKMSKELIVDLSQRYITAYEKLSGRKFKPFQYPIEKRITQNISTYLPENKLEICKKTRKIASVTLKNVLEQALKSKKEITEKGLANQWLKELRKNKDVCSKGWYFPPPNGVGVLFGTSKDFTRIGFQSLRPKENWPNSTVLNREDGLIITYVSPVDKHSGIIGDFGMTIYLGRNKQLQDHLKKVLKAIRETYNNIMIGMKFSDVYKLTLATLKKYELDNNWWISISDPTGINVGHTIPFSYENMSTSEKRILENRANWSSICSLISKKRKFLNSVEDLKVQPGMAFTLEPRPQVKSKNLPVVWFHHVILINEDGTKELLTDFDNIFKIAGMKYML